MTVLRPRQRAKKRKHKNLSFPVNTKEWKHVATIFDKMNSTKSSILTQSRHAISPYLPPPILNLIKNIDSNPHVRTYVEHEPSMCIMVALVAVYFLSKIARFLTVKKKAVEGLDADDPEGQVLSNIQGGVYTDSVILFGVCGGGKTVLFHKLTHESQLQEIQTVTSLKANVKVTDEGIRIIDYPGHITLSTKLPSLLMPSNNSSSSRDTRALLIVDSTKPLTDTASYLYQNLLTNSQLIHAWRNTNRTMNVLVVCNKNDAPGAKNWRRIKIQLRTEIDKLIKISSSMSNGGYLNDENRADKHFELIGKSIDLDDLNKNGISNIKLSFVEASCVNGNRIREVKEFVNKGEIKLENDSSATKSKR